MHVQGVELRQHRRDNWARDHARIRRHGPAERQGWQPGAVVDAGHRVRLPGEGAVHCGAVRRDASARVGRAPWL